MIERWEHMMVILDSQAEPYWQFLQQRWPQAQFPYYSPFAVLPQLDMYGQQGWELVAIQPVIMGKDGNVLVSQGGMNWAHQYLCTFKRRIMVDY